MNAICTFYFFLRRVLFLSVLSLRIPVESTPYVFLLLFDFYHDLDTDSILIPVALGFLLVWLINSEAVGRRSPRTSHCRSRFCDAGEAPLFSGCRFGALKCGHRMFGLGAGS